MILLPYVGHKYFKHLQHTYKILTLNPEYVNVYIHYIDNVWKRIGLVNIYFVCLYSYRMYSGFVNVEAS
jgi:hypothetical protein